MSTEPFVEDVITIAVRRPADPLAAAKQLVAVHEAIAGLQGQAGLFPGATVTHQTVKRQPAKQGPKGPRKPKLQAAA